MFQNISQVKMHLRNILTVSVTVSLVLMQLTLAFQLEKGTFYAIRNELDKSYLKAISNGALCKRRGDVIATNNLVRSSEAYKWKYWEAQPGRAVLRGQRFNELTMEKIPPYCYFQFAEYKLTHINGKAFTVEDIRTKKCLTGAGMQKRISWETCQAPAKKYTKQYWSFIDLGKKAAKE